MNLKEFTEKYGNKEVEEAKLKELLGIKDSKVWKPTHNEAYWFISNVGDIYEATYRKNYEVEERLYNIGNCYKTEEEAIFARDKQIFMTKLERDFIESSEEIDWEDKNQCKYNLQLYNGDVVKNVQFISCFGIPVTTDKEWLENYIKENKADIKKYYFGKGE